IANRNASALTCGGNRTPRRGVPLPVHPLDEISFAHHASAVPTISRHSPDAFGYDDSTERPIHSQSLQVGTALAALMRSTLVVAVLAVAGCRPERASRPLFKLLTPGRTGVTFANTITTSDSVNVQTDPYIYNG